ncbi:MAG: transposase [Bacteroidales bacterium]|nr:transposase [Bacteroidales bacterium]
MKGRYRVFKSGALHHVYQCTYDGFLIFYSIRDFLIFFTLFCTVARKYHIRVLGLCLMYDHIHVLVAAPSKNDLSAFVQEYTSRFSRQRNTQYQRKGPFFKRRFGSAPKSGEKKARTAIAYLYNNPVEKKLCKLAEDYQWDFLTYANNHHPFSQPMKLSKASRPMRRAVAEISSLRASDTPLNYAIIERIIKELSPKEIKQLTDYIVSSYNCIDYQGLEEYYEDFQTMLIAIHSNTGSEYDIKEVISPDSDVIFKKMLSIIRKMTPYHDMTEVLSLPASEKQRLSWILSAETGASPRQIAKFLHLSHAD